MPALHLISSMATRAWLAELNARFTATQGFEVALEAVGGVDAARRVAAGEAFDVVVLADEALAQLCAQGHAVASSQRALLRSEVVAGVREGSPATDISSEDALKAALLAAPTIGYSTGPSGTALLALFTRWGLAQTLTPRLVQARPGVPVARLVSSGEVALGFQQRSEMAVVPGVVLLGPLPGATAITSLFSAALCTRCKHADAASAWLALAASADAAQLKRQHGFSLPETLA
jgi:molybdate transport system substrate-binding protein